ncbi:MAG: Glycerate kinase [Caldanaerobacter subterraneus]|jgi:glycerate kinase|uniref:Uncharacterized protein n=1 Tax=Caldanaerobacter subterraneus TaxID=911092 RepID=A0A124FC97_9THEO|nr:hypothetical protein [Caldanaerobacter subterraneus]KUK07956.1 MAG: Glycerate kinase [Caldanaerobacter subterraneus]MBZ4669683.1 glycerate kinase [Defluviitaleaceae bacterium]HBT49762.1 hypothetical protein [Caldanaerobacter subterraneus]
MHKSNFEEYTREGIVSVFSIVDIPSTLERCMEESKKLLSQTTKSIVNLIGKSESFLAFISEKRMQ